MAMVIAGGHMPVRCNRHQCHLLPHGRGNRVGVHETRSDASAELGSCWYAGKGVGQMSPLFQLSEDDDEHFSAWPLIIAIAMAKIVTLVVVLYFAWNGEAAALIGATILPWIVVAVGLLAAPVAWQVRLRRVRRRRQALQDAEWMGDSEFHRSRSFPIRRSESTKVDKCEAPCCSRGLSGVKRTPVREGGFRRALSAE